MEAISNENREFSRFSLISEEIPAIPPGKPGFLAEMKGNHAFPGKTRRISKISLKIPRVQPCAACFPGGTPRESAIQQGKPGEIRDFVEISKEF